MFNYNWCYQATGRDKLRFIRFAIEVFNFKFFQDTKFLVFSIIRLWKSNLLAVIVIRTLCVLNLILILPFKYLTQQKPQINSEVW